ncbi:MAG TPA: enoyl-CoA hydratase-related protein, partial [Balneolaceae bacterium]|nr:enoyl-CoA hydratase-related protein [Balneolaceae bacterium]
MNENYNTILYSVDDENIATLTINRPDKLNALNDEVINELADAIKVIENDEAVKGVIVTGAGEKA